MILIDSPGVCIFIANSCKVPTTYPNQEFTIWPSFPLLSAHTIPFNLVLSVMERHQLICDDNRTIKSASVISLLHDIFYAADKLSLISKPLHWQEGHVASTFDADRKASLLSSFLATVFDP